MKIKWVRLALKDIQSIADFISIDSTAVSKKIIQLIYSRVQILANQPYIGRSGRVNDTRELVIDGTPFIVPYRIKNNEVEILRIMHASRKWPETF